MYSVFSVLAKRSISVFLIIQLNDIDKNAAPANAEDTEKHGAEQLSTEKEYDWDSSFFRLYVLRFSVTSVLAKRSVLYLSIW